MTICVIRPGMLSTVQDAGRPGLERQGIGPGGAMDPLALQLANVLVGNSAGAAALELTLTGPALRFESDALIAITGANLTPAIDGVPLPAGRAILVRGGVELGFGACSQGCRAYLALAGGIDLPVVLGSRATNLRARFGGIEGRALRAGDRLPVGMPSDDGVRLIARLARSNRAWIADSAGLARELAARPAGGIPIRLLPGADVERLAGASRTALVESAFRVSPKSDRMGYRLEGTPLSVASNQVMTSEAVTSGTVQLPPDGHPIILLADRQTTGGYPVIGHVATVDLPVIAQRKPGDEVRFVPITLAAAQRALIDRDRAMRIAIQSLHAARLRE